MSDQQLKKIFRWSIVLLVLVIIAFCCLCFVVKTEQKKTKSERIKATERVAIATIDSTLNYEIPTGKRNEIVVKHIGYVVSYNPEWKIPNWVAYELTASEANGEEPRDDDFMPDPDIESSYSATLQDYKKSGYDRGHMAPAGDMKWSRQAMAESFYLSNICPQNSNLNRGDWKDLEELVRMWALSYENVYVICGPIVTDRSFTIGRNKVLVPDAFFKAVLLYKNKKWQTIGFIFENKAGNKKIGTYAQSVDWVENITGLDLFEQLPDSIENEIESKYNLEDWNL